jgi:hypothetical protein
MVARHAPCVKTRNPEPDDDVELPPAEAARDRRRDHDLRAIEREGMRTGLAKQFKQVLDAQVRRGRAAEEESRLDEELSRTPKSPRRPHGTAGRHLA